MQSFTYKSLDHGDSQIRLVCLLPLRIPSNAVSDQAQLRCSIKTISLRDNPEYTALSYTWGDSSRTSLLIINDSADSSEAALHITKSVETALLHLRHSTSTITLWIDQLCINQGDDAEKSSQVQLMKAIYEGAREVIVWLGPAVDGSDNLIDILTEIGKKACEAGILEPDASISEKNDAFKASYSELIKSNSLGPDFTIPMESLRSFVDRSWWTRMWVVQELSVALSVNFACGSQKISYDHLRNALYFYTFYIRKLVDEFLARYSMVRLFFSAEKQRTLFGLCSAPVDSAAMKMLTSRYQYQCQMESNGGHSLYRILKVSHVVGYSNVRLDATDHRDKIFGLLGLARDAQELGIWPEYDKKCREVYIKVAKALIEAGHVDLLWFCQFPKLMDDLPTWTPDWSAESAPIKTPYGDNFSESSSSFAASGKAEARTGHTENSEKYVSLPGVFVDRVDVIGSPWGSLPEGDFFEAACQFIQEINLFCNETPRNETKQSPKALEEARWRTPIGDKEWNDVGTAQRATESSREVYEEVLRRMNLQKFPNTGPERVQSMQFLTNVGPFLNSSWFLTIAIVLYAYSCLSPLLSARAKKNFPIETRPGLSYMNFMKEMYNRRPFRTKNGYVGLGPVEMISNDVLCIVFGAQVPYVLRPCGGSRYQLVG